MGNMQSRRSADNRSPAEENAAGDLKVGMSIMKPRCVLVAGENEQRHYSAA